jgi:hypothetical protein
MVNTSTSPRDVPATSPAAGRSAVLDLIRVAVISMVIVHHAAQPYGPTGGSWPVTDTAQSDLFRPFYTVNAAVGLGLLFLLAGYLVPKAYDRKGPRRFLRERWSRLGVPLVVFALAIDLPIAWVTERPGSLAEFVTSLYGDAWRPLYLHLWFVGHLLLYSAAYVIWRRFAGHPHRVWATPGHRTILAFTAGLVTVSWIVRWWYAIDDWVPLLGIVPVEPAHLPQYASLFVLGVMAYRSDWLQALPTRVGRRWLAVGLSASLAMVAMQTLAPHGWHYNTLADGGLGWQSAVRSTLEGLICVGLAVGLPVVLRDLTHRPLPLVSAAAMTSYAAYILHVYILVPLQASITGLDLSPFLKFGFVAGLGLLLSFGAARLSGRVPGVRRLLGTTPSDATSGQAGPTVITTLPRA